jgi:hypothetical protein
MAVGGKSLYGRTWVSQFKRKLVCADQASVTTSGYRRSDWRVHGTDPDWHSLISTEIKL